MQTYEVIETGTSPTPSEYEKLSDIWHIVKFKRNLGIGAFSNVCLVETLDSKEECALKIIKRETKSMFMKELKLLKRLDCPQIVRFKKAYADPQSYYIMMEYCAGDSLIKRMANKKIYTEGCASQNAKTMLLAIKHLHDRNIVHRDIKPENFVYLSDADAGLKLIDFGIAKEISPYEKYSLRAGTPWYMAPEVVRNVEDRQGIIYKKSDMWSFGVCIFIMLNGQPPFIGSSKDSLFYNILFQNQIKFSCESISSEAKDLVFKLLQRVPAERLSVDQALRHPWIVTGGKNENEIMKTTIDALKLYSTKYAIQRALQNVAVKNMDEGDEELCRKLFNKFDTNRDGNITREECIEALLRDGAKEEEAIRVSETMILSTDDNNDNLIQYDEFKHAIVRHGITTDEHKMLAIFNALDANNDGFIVINEFTSCLPEGADAERDKLVQAFKAADENNDDKLTWNEFKKILATSGSSKNSVFDAFQVDPREMDQVITDNKKFEGSDIEDVRLVVVDAHNQVVGNSP